MYIETLKARNFRNFSELEAEFSRGVNIFYGRNGSGKTNLLEALFVMCLGRSQRGAGDAVMLRSEADVFRLEGKLHTSRGSSEVAVAYQKNTRKKVVIDGVTSRLTDLYENASVVSGGPEDSQILSGSPAVRRMFTDIYLSQLSRSYLDDLSNYVRCLAQKNAALKAESDSSAFDSLLVEYGSRVISARAVFLEQIRSLTIGYYRDVSGGGVLEMEYRPSIGRLDTAGDRDGIASLFTERLERMAERERIMKTAMVGPHRDEIDFHISGYPARSFASQGEWRTAAISLKLAVNSLLREKRGLRPVLLLDEIFAELDDRRTGALIEAFGDFGQLFLTTAVDPPDGLRSRSTSFSISDGKIEGVG